MPISFQAGNMKRRDYLVILFTALLFAGVSLWVMQWPSNRVRHVTLAVITNAPGATTFRLQNGERLELFLSRLFVEQKTYGGWRVVNEITPSADQVVKPGRFHDVTLTAPGGTDVWRLRVAYGEAIAGPMLFLAKADFAVHEHRIPGSGFGVFAGSNSLSSAEIRP